MPISTSGHGPDLPPLAPNVVTLAPPLGRATITVLTGSPLPIGQAYALTQPGAYILVFRRHDDRPAVYVGMSGAIADRLLRHERLRPNEGTVEVIAITSDAGDIDRSDAMVLERLAYTVLKNWADVEVLNAEPPFHGRVPTDRYRDLRVLLGDACCRLANSGLLPFRGPTINLLAGPELAFSDMIEPVDPIALVGCNRRRFVKRGLAAEALFLTNDCAVLKAGSEICATEVSTLHGGISSLRLEAAFSGIVAPDFTGILTVRRDLTFFSWNSMAQFVSASASGQVPRWRVVEPHRAVAHAPLGRDDDLLSMWRCIAPPVGHMELADALQSVLMTVAPIGAVDWRRARRGDLASAVGIAIKATNAAPSGPATRVLDVAMSALFLCAVMGEPSAIEVLHSLIYMLSVKGLPIHAPVKCGVRP